jgi:hypothetical protein
MFNIDSIFKLYYTKINIHRNRLMIGITVQLSIRLGYVRLSQVRLG